MASKIVLHTQGQSRPPSSTSTNTNKDESQQPYRDREASIRVLPHPAEDLSADDDLLSWILVDQLGCMPNTKLGVHPQQVKFVGPTFKTDEVLTIVKETVTKGNIQAAMQRLQEFHLIKSHLEGKMTDLQRERFIQHMRRYLLTLTPLSRIEIHLTSRYTFITGHTELAVFATRPLDTGIVMSELQGSVVPLPDQWREEMEIGDDFAVEAAGEESDSESEPDDEDDYNDNENGSVTSSTAAAIRRDKGKGKEMDGNGKRPGQRRSDRTKRRDFSIVWSGLKRCYQLFLGPARFLNHDCNPNVELLRQGKHVTFRVCRPIKVGEELTTFYGDNYFGRANVECLCLTCEQTSTGGFTPGSSILATLSRASSLNASRRDSSPTMRDSVNRDLKAPRPSSLRHQVIGRDSDDESESTNNAPGPSRSLLSLSTTKRDSDLDNSNSNDAESEVDGGDPDTDTTPATSRKGYRPGPSSLALRVSPAPTVESVASDAESSVDRAPLRKRSVRKAAQNIKPYIFSQRPKGARSSKVVVEEEQTDTTDDFPDDFPRCATCAKPLTEQIWFNGRYFEHCQRCVRHALVFELPWPAHRPQDVQAFPPSHLVPPGYIPRRVTNVPLPTLSKAPRVKVVEVPISPANESRELVRARKLREQIEREEFFIESLREAAWSVQEAKEAAVKAAEEAREAARLARIEAKRKMEEGKIKGTGLWQRYAYITEEELQKRKDEKNQVLSGTRRGGRFRAKEDEEEMKKLAEEARKKELEDERQRELQEQRDAAEKDSERGEEIDQQEQSRAGDGPFVNGASKQVTVQERDESKPKDTPKPKNEEKRSTETADTLRNNDPDLCTVAALGPLVSPSTISVPSKTGSPSTPAPQRVKGRIIDNEESPVRTERGRPDAPISIASTSEQTHSRSPSVSGSESLRKRGRPPGTGKRQKAAASKLAKVQVEHTKARKPSTSPEIVFVGEKLVSGHIHSHGKSKGKEKVIDNVPTSSLSKRLSYVNGATSTSNAGVKAPGSSSPASSRNKRAAPHESPLSNYLVESASYDKTQKKFIDGPSSSPSISAAALSPVASTSTLSKTSTTDKFPSLVSSYRPRNRKSDGSGSSVDAASSTLSVGSAESSLPSTSTSTVISLSTTKAARRSDADFISVSSPKSSTTRNPFQSLHARAPGAGASASAAGWKFTSMKNPSSSVTAQRGENVKSFSTKQDHVYVTGKGKGKDVLSTEKEEIERKRKRISDASDVSSASPTSQAEKKKRTFFPSVISVQVFKPTPAIPKPKHSLSKM